MFSLRRDQLTKDDIKVYAAVSEKPGSSFPNVGRWYDSVSSHLAERLVGFSICLLSKDCKFVCFLFVCIVSVYLINLNLIQLNVIRIVCLLYSFPGKAVGVSVSNQAAPAAAAPAAAPKVCPFFFLFKF